VAGLALTLFLLGGCALGSPARLDVPFGQRAVLGRVDLSRFEVTDALLEVVREDGTFGTGLYAGPGDGVFVLVLPPGRYRIPRVRAVQDRASVPTETVWDVAVSFEVGPEPAVYIGTLQLVSRWGRAPAVSVVDEFARTVPAARARYRDLPEPVARRLARAA
jgi:hypothetical protein